MEYHYQTGALTRPEIYQGIVMGLVLQISTQLSLKHDAIIFQQWPHIKRKKKKCSSTKKKLEFGHCDQNNLGSSVIR